MKLLKIATFIFAATAMFSCSSKKIAYFRNIENSAIAAQVPDPIVKVGDVLSIIVSGEDPMGVAQFNLPMVLTATYSETVNVSNQRLQPYIVEKDGTVNIPVLGKVVLAGLSRLQAVEAIQLKLLAYVKKPIVTIQYLNFKVTILGELAKPGTYQIQDEKVTLPQALGLAGDLTIYGRRDNVLLVREKIDGEKEIVRINLNEAKILSSDYYYLKQNDILYVEPNKTKLLTSSASAVTIPLGVISTLASLTAIIVSVANK